MKGVLEEGKREEAREAEEDNQLKEAVLPQKQFYSRSRFMSRQEREP